MLTNAFAQISINNISLSINYILFLSLAFNFDDHSVQRAKGPLVWFGSRGRGVVYPQTIASWSTFPQNCVGPGQNHTVTYAHDSCQ
ncbi:hypothetical protein X975_08024, partial [Stegodyphus mimosarum]